MNYVFKAIERWAAESPERARLVIISIWVVLGILIVIGLFVAAEVMLPPEMRPI